MASVILKWLVYSHGPKVAYFFGLGTSLYPYPVGYWYIWINRIGRTLGEIPWRQGGWGGQLSGGRETVSIGLADPCVARLGGAVAKDGGLGSHNVVLEGNWNC